MCRLGAKGKGILSYGEVKGRFAGPRLCGPKSLECYLSVHDCSLLWNRSYRQGTGKNVITGKPGRRARGKGPHSSSLPGELGKGETGIALKHGQSHLPVTTQRFYNTLFMKPPDRTCCPQCFSLFVLFFLLSVLFLFLSNTETCRSERDS